MRKFLVLITVLCLLPVACSKDPYTAAMQASLSVSDSVAQAIPIVQQLQQAGLITAAEAHTVYTYLNTVTVGNGIFRNTTRSLHASGNKNASAYLLAADTFVKSANSANVLASIHIVNPASQQKIMLYLNAVDTVLNGIATVIQNNTTTPQPAPTPTTGAFVWTPSPSLT